jgi:hypothetical protein
MLELVGQGEIEVWDERLSVFFVRGKVSLVDIFLRQLVGVSRADVVLL